MHNVIMFALFLIILIQDNLGDMNGNDFICKLIKISFGKPFCLYYIHDSTSNVTILNKVLIKQELQVVSLNVANIRQLRYANITCDGYIFESNDVNTTKNMFSNRTINLYFQPHKRILFFTEIWRYFDISTIHAATAWQDLDLVIVEVEKNERNGDRKQTLLHKESQINVVLVGLEKVIRQNDTFSAEYLTKEKWKPEKVLKKYGFNFSVIYFDCPPYFLSHKNYSVYEGVEMEMVKVMTRNWPINYKFVEVEATTNNFFLNSFTNIINNKGDLATCSHIRQRTHPEMERSYPYARTCITFLVPRPVLLSDITFLVQPLQLSLWIAYFAILIIVSLFLKLMETQGFRDDTKTLTNYLCEDVFQSIISVLRVGSSGSMIRTPKSDQVAARVLSIVLLVFCMLLSTYYSAGLTISLRFPRYSYSINTLEDFVKYDVKWQSTQNFSFLNYYWENTQTRIIVEMAKRFVFAGDTPEAMKRLNEMKYALLVGKLDGTDADYLGFADKVDDYGRKHLTTMSDGNMGCFDVSFPLRINSPFLDSIDKSILHIREFGFIHYWYKEFVSKPKYRFMKLFFQKPLPQDFRIINLSRMQGSLYFLLLGHLFATFIFFLECLLHRK
ncbi:uncharacterized protein [Tenebrio molitor]|jgi:hypothetical protein|uniref:uncharacterized protein n=1 Tax=Tenebrio molitor TaxID=7067 RepID=UPI0036247E61